MTDDTLPALRRFHHVMALEDALVASLGLVMDALEDSADGALLEGFVDRLREAHQAGSVERLLDECLDREACALERTMILDRLRGVDEAADESRTRVEVDEREGELFVVGHAEIMFHVDHFFAAVGAPAIAARLASLELTAEDVGANGTRSFDLGPLLEGDRNYPKLRLFSLPRAKPGDHNRTVVTWHDSYDEKGGLGALLDRAPALVTLRAGAAPSAPFFERAAHPLEALCLSAGYDHQGFVRGLASSHCFARLRALEFADYAETYIDNWEAQRTPRKDLDALFQSTGLPALRHLILVGTMLEASERAALLATPLGRQLESLVVRPSPG